MIAVAGPCLCSASAPAACCHAPDLPQASLQFDKGVIRIDLKRAPGLLKKGASGRIVDEGRSVDLVVVHVEKKRYVALDRKCTHGGGPVTYIEKRRIVQCTCWGHSQFGLDGTVVTGPAKKKLGVHEVRVAGDTIEIRTEPKA